MRRATQEAAATARQQSKRPHCPGAFPATGAAHRHCRSSPSHKVLIIDLISRSHQHMQYSSTHPTARLDKYTVPMRFLFGFLYRCRLCAFEALHPCVTFLQRQRLVVPLSGCDPGIRTTTAKPSAFPTGQAAGARREVQQEMAATRRSSRMARRQLQMGAGRTFEQPPRPPTYFGSVALAAHPFPTVSTMALHFGARPFQ